MPVLGPDGTPRAYAKRRYAAHFRDNPTGNQGGGAAVFTCALICPPAAVPATATDARICPVRFYVVYVHNPWQPVWWPPIPAGDFLLSLDLQDGDGSASGASGGVAASGSSSASAALPAAGKTRTLLELVLEVLLHAARASPVVAVLLHRRDLLAFCDVLAGYCTPAVVSAAQQLYAALADSLPTAAEELLQSGAGTSMGGSASSSPGGSSAGSGAVAGLAGLLLHSATPRLLEAALGKLAAVADTCSGDDFALLTGLDAGTTATQSAVVRAWQLAAAGAGSATASSGQSPGMLAAARRFVLRCAERAQRQQGLSAGAAPRGGGWTVIGRAPLQQLLRVEALQGAAGKAAAAAAAAAKAEAGFGGSLKRGFFAAPLAGAAPKPRQPATSAMQPAAPSPRPGHQTKNGGRGSPAATGSSAGTGITTSSYKQGAVTIEELEEEKEPACGQRAEQVAPAGSRDEPQYTPQAAQLPEVGAAAELLRHEGDPWAGQEDELQGSADAEEDVPDLQDVFDSSSAVPARLRRERAAWAALPLDKKLK